MAFTGASLNDGQVATSWGTVYGPGAGAKAILRSADFHNTNAVTQTVEFAITRSGSSRRIIARVAGLLQNEKVELLTDGEVITLSASDVLEAQTTTATAVDFVITGATE